MEVIKLNGGNLKHSSVKKLVYIDCNALQLPHLQPYLHQLQAKDSFTSVPRVAPLSIIKSLMSKSSVICSNYHCCIWHIYTWNAVCYLHQTYT